jgi:type-F conjugative transfer system secretin TraK
MRNKLIACVMLVLCSMSAFGGQNIQVNENNVIRIVVSKNDINMLSLKNDRIDSLALPGSVTVEQDRKSGSAYLTFKGSEIVKGFLTSEMGYKYQVEFVPTDIEAETIVLSDTVVAKESFVATPGEYTQKLAQLLRAMSNNADLEGYQVEIHDKKTRVNGKDFILESTYNGPNFFGEVFYYKNDTKELHELTEVAFYQPGVRAVAIDEKILLPDSVAKIYIIRSDR